MPKSIKLAKAIEICVYMARHHPESVTTKEIAKSLNDHPARIRQLVSEMVKNKILRTTRGPGGGSSLAMEPAEITLADIFKAVEDQSVLALSVPWSSSDQALELKLGSLFSTFENKLMKDLDSYSLTYFQ